MTDADEKLSFLLDDFRDEDSAAALDEVIDDVNLQYRMRRYQMIGEVMRHELPPAIDTEFHQSVMARVHAEQKPAEAESAAASAAVAPSRFGWAALKPFAGLAVAASVAAVTVALWQPLQQQDGQGEGGLVSTEQQKIERLAGQVTPDVVPASTSAQPLGMRWKIERDTPGLQQKLNAYLVNHTEYSNPVQGLIPQARVAGFDAQRQ